MPYEWTDQSGGLVRLLLWPHRSLPRRGFAGFILVTSFMIAMPLLWLLGTVLLWALLPFLLLAVTGLWWALEKSYRDGDIREELRIVDSHVYLTHTNPKGHVRQWDCNRYWVQVELHATGGPMPNYVTLSGADRQVEIGAFLSEDERKALYPEIADALRPASGA